MTASLPGGGEVVAIADGMGGHAAGDLASRLAVDILIQELRAGAEIPQAFHGANSVVHETSQREAGCRGMGTTLVAVVSRGPSYQIANVGDSRAYRIDGMGIQQITTDHSFVAEAVRSGGLSLEEASRSPWRNALTRSLGTSTHAEADLFGPFSARATPHLVLLCSDGVHKVLSDAAIRQIALRAENGTAAVGMLITAAYQHDSDDNMTVAVVEFGSFFQPEDVPTEPLQMPAGRAGHSLNGKVAVAG